MGERVVVAMSGGVDSSVAALLLKRAGHEVIGAFMNNWEDEAGEEAACPAEADWRDVRKVCETLGIPYYAVGFAKEYRERVFDHFLDELKKGRTPNPDALCNREIKFDAFAAFARELGAARFATGHFARLDRRGGEARLMLSADPSKDQTYFLYMVGERAFRDALFPVGDLTKAEVRALAREAGLPNGDKKDSTGICFIGERKFKAFLMNYLPAQPGPIEDSGGRRLGTHDGLMYYTLGQRRGLGVGGGIGNGKDGRRWFVVGKDLARNALIVDSGEDTPALYSSGAWVGALHWVAGSPPSDSFDCEVRLRHRQPLQRARAAVRGDEMSLSFETPQRAVTPGQAAVVYLGEECLGGGAVDASIP